MRVQGALHDETTNFAVFLEFFTQTDQCYVKSGDFILTIMKRDKKKNDMLKHSVQWLRQYWLNGFPVLLSKIKYTSKNF